jgi:hypothetical protein
MMRKGHQATAYDDGLFSRSHISPLLGYLVINNFNEELFHIIYLSPGRLQIGYSSGKAESATFSHSLTGCLVIFLLVG